MLANALSRNCKSTETESKSMQMLCYATELTAMVTRCLDNRKGQLNDSFPWDCFDVYEKRDKVIGFHNHNNFVGGWNCNKASDIWKFSQIGRVVLKADFEKIRAENTVAHRVHRFNKEITTQRKKIPCKHKIHIEKNISSTLQTKLKLYKKYAHCKQKNCILKTKLLHTLQTKKKL